MKEIKLILKGMLLWITTFVIVLFISGIDSIYNNGYLIHSMAVCALLCYTCYKCINKEEIEDITLYKYFNNWLEKQNNR